MNKPFVRAVSLLAIGVALVALTSRSALASDHADPIVVTKPEANITGLFFFPKDDQMILILNVRRALVAGGPYNLEPYEYRVFMDLHSALTFDDGQDRLRYGGTVVNPDGISPDVTLKFRLNNDTSVRAKTISGLRDPDGIRVWTGVRDDPFIFPRFFKRNVISMVLSIPLTSFPEGQQDWLLWGTVTDASSGEQLDHVGRSSRTQLGRFGFLNTIPPNQQVAAIAEMMKKTNKIDAWLNKFAATIPIENLYHYVLQLRHYDLFPDVMVYTHRFPPGFPNGRQLPDDVAALTCQLGDCILQELSFVEGGYPRATTNDKPFLDQFPYLAEPWPDMPDAAKKSWPLWPVVLMALLLVVALIWLLCRWCRRRHRG